MNRISVTFYDKIYEKLEARMKENGAKSVAHCVRELVDLGLKVEAAAKKNNEKSSEDPFEKVINMMENNLKWSLESRLLTRYLVENLPENSPKLRADILREYKEKAISHVDGMLNKPEN